MSVIFLILMAILEYGQAIADCITHDYPRAIVMAGAGTSSLAMMYM